ncbi:MAG: HD domain-containing protein [Candidatus Thorarchaeota archaeon]|nr:HD domain-containing protein [Candidatus Thorarchaeota archaeon]
MKPSDVEFLLTASRLKRLHRVGWLMSVGADESVASHMWGTALAALLLVNESEHAHDVNIARVLLMAILHDLPEAILSDIPHDRIPADLKTRLEKQVFTELVARLDQQGQLSEAWRELTEGRTVEARTVLAADVIDMVVQALFFERAGVRPEALHEFFTSGLARVRKTGIQAAIDLFELLYQEHMNRHQPSSQVPDEQES